MAVFPVPNSFVTCDLTHLVAEKHSASQLLMSTQNIEPVHAQQKTRTIALGPLVIGTYQGALCSINN